MLSPVQWIGFVDVPGTRFSPVELEREIAQEIGRGLAAGDVHARALRSEIAAVLKRIDTVGTMLLAVTETSGARVGGDAIAVITLLGTSFAELSFLISDLPQAAAHIQKTLEGQRSNVRAVREQNARQSADIRLIREDLAAIARRASAEQIAVRVRAGNAFISYVREDSEQVDDLQRVLLAAGVPVWRDTADLWPGEDWRTIIRRAITDDALVFLACFSKKSLARNRSYQNEELTLAIEQLRMRRPDDPWLIPVRFDECDIPDRDIGGGRTLASIQRADLFGDRVDEGVTRLVASILRILRRHSDTAVVDRYRGTSSA